MSAEPLAYKQDWPRAVERLMAFWQGQVIDRACVQITCPRPKSDWPSQREMPVPASLAQRWLDTEFILDRAELDAGRTCFLGESFPCYWPNIGPETLAAYLGCKLEFSKTTSWTAPLPAPAGQTFPRLSFDPNNFYYQWVKKQTAAAVQRFRGKMIVGLTALAGGGDTLAAIRDPQQLCLDLIEQPGAVHEAMAFTRRFMQERFRENVTWTIGQGGTTTWLPCFSTGAYACTQTDFIVLVSPAMFREFFLPDIEQAGLDADHVCYHLDGPGELKHLDALLAMDNLHAIQWVPLPGTSKLIWMDLYKRIRAAGKGLQLSVKEPSEVIAIIEELSPEGLLLSINMKDMESAEQLLRDVERASAKKAR